MAIIDKILRYLKAVPLQNTDKKIIINALIKYFCIFVLCREIGLHNAAYFKVKDFKGYISNLNIELTYGSI